MGEELSFVGGGFDYCNYEESCDELMVTSPCPQQLDTDFASWELDNTCGYSFAPSSASDLLPSATGPYEGEQYHTAASAKTYAQAAAWSSEHDAAWVPLVEPMPIRRPRAASVAEAARLAMHSRACQQTMRAEGRHQSMQFPGVLGNRYNVLPASRREGLTYAEVAQQPDPQPDLRSAKFDSRSSIFTSTENSACLPNQVIYKAPQQLPQRTVRTSMIHVAPYPPARDPRNLPQDVHIPTLIEPEHNHDPRDPYALVQRTGRGGHREPVVLSLDVSSISSPLSCGTPSTISATSRPRRKGNAMKDPTLPFRCPDCGRTYAEKDYLTRHIRRSHSEVQSRPHPCSKPDCAWRFVNPKDLKRHEKTHAGNTAPAFPCLHLFCMKSFTRRDNRDRHIRAEHTEDSGLGTSRSSSEFAVPC